MPGGRAQPDSLFPDAPQAAPVGYALVAPERSVDLGDGGFTYAIPPKLADLVVGQRVNVPLGRGDTPVAGFVLERHEQCPLPEGKRDKIKPITARDEHAVSLTPDLVKLARWIAAYYCCPLGMVFGTMLPAAVKHGTGATTQTLAALPDPDHIDTRLTKLQQAVVDALRDAAREDRQWVELHALADTAGAKSTAPVKTLIDKGVLRSKQMRAVVSDLDLRAQREAGAVPPPRLDLSPQQQAALDHLFDHLDNGFSVHLIHGVTGSGKTEVYLRAIEQLLSPGSGTSAPVKDIPGVIVLVPEIALTPQTVGRFLGRFPDGSVAVLHSGLTAAQRHTQWRRIRDGEAHIVVGARSAIFAPLPNLRLIIVDEEHESSYKQDQLPRYHARDVAVRRGQLLDVPVMLGSATPSLESYHNATRPEGSYHLVSLPDRVPGMTMPTVEVVDMIEERRQRRGIHLISRKLENELARTLGHTDQGVGTSVPSKAPEQAQAILLLNRRGYANYLACPDHKCGWMMRCDHCDATMVYHLNKKLPSGGVVRCHHCLAEQPLATHCPACGNAISIFGLGTQRVEEELERKFPGVRAIRMDSDAMRTARHYQQALDRFRAGDADVLLGTQMIAKGLDFPGVRLVGVISADTSLHLPDFRAAERTFQLISQVSGRSGRSTSPGKVVVQTFSADDPVIELAAEHDYVGFAQRELGLRAEVGLPPISRMARIVVRDRDHTKAVAEARKLAASLKAFNDQLKLGVRLRGPAPCPLSRLADHHRQQVELLAQDAATLQKLMTALRNAKLLKSDTHTAVDVDPVALL
ncbi:MAG: primosomal protein N' [Planctomycetes bacterium]|jgi:primosomal protein N' (replication factor Y)|nr:primosomal protein N' [Planctomycetota bacterium]